jgi:hypothetical protein
MHTVTQGGVGRGEKGSVQEHMTCDCTKAPHQPINPFVYFHQQPPQFLLPLCDACGRFLFVEAPQHQHKIIPIKRSLNDLPLNC